MTEKLLTARELGEGLSLSPSRILDMSERGELPGAGPVPWAEGGSVNGRAPSAERGRPPHARQAQL